MPRAPTQELELSRHVVVEVEVKLRGWKILVCALCTLLVACGSDSQGTIPQAPAPTEPGTVSIPSAGTSTNSQIPDMTDAADVLLDHKKPYTELELLAGVIYGDLVGVPKLLPKITSGRETQATGSVWLTFEDEKGVWGTDIQSFPGTNTHSSSFLDMIFSDDKFVLRVQGGISSGTITSGRVYFRVRQSGEKQCLENSSPSVDTVTPCLSYMDTSSSSVKRLGTFTKTGYLVWVE